MTITLNDDRAAHRYELTVGEELACVAEYVVGPGRLELVYTEVVERFAGRGLATRLVIHALRDAKRRGLEVVPTCSFVAGVIARNREEFSSLVSRTHRGEFGLDES